MEENKTPRKRVANFTADEKALLAQLVKKRPIIETKYTDGKSILKKKSAWMALTEEFNSNANVHKRDTQILKRAWDNLKAVTRKTRATQRGNLLRTGGGPSDPPPPPQQAAIISMVEEAAPVIICEVNNSFDSDGSILLSMQNKENEDFFVNCSTSTIDILDTNDTMVINGTGKEMKEMEDSQATQTGTDLGGEENTVCESEDIALEFCASATPKNVNKEQAEQRKPSDYIRREAVLRIQHFQTKKKLELQLLKAKLENEEIKKLALETEREKNGTLLEIAKLELAELKKRLDS